MKIAILDDNRAYAEVLKEILIFKDNSVKVFGNGRDLLNDRYLMQYDIIIIDLTLPDQYGLSVIREIKEMNVKATIIVASIDFSVMVSKRLYDMGIRHLLKKPFVFDDLNKILVSIKKVEWMIEDFIGNKKEGKKMLLLTDGSNYKILHNLRKTNAEELKTRTDEFDAEETCILEGLTFSMLMEFMAEMNKRDVWNRMPRLIVPLEEDLSEISTVLKKRNEGGEDILKRAFVIDLKFAMS